MTQTFAHVHAAHCESGVIAALFGNKGFALSEPMAFGVGSGLYFFYVPFVKVMGMPIVSFRSYPGRIFKKACKRLGVRYVQKSFLRRRKGVAALDALLAGGEPVGVQANMFWLHYFPREFRFQFNGHNLIVTGANGTTYAVSDPVLEAPVTCSAEALTRARFAKGLLAPRGTLYYPTRFPDEPERERAVLAGVRDTCRAMLRSPGRFVGVRGIRSLARDVRAWPRRMEERKVKLHLGHVIRMQEEVGTGGAGFRFMYAAFLQEAGELLDRAPFREASRAMTEAGDRWRLFAVECGRLIKGRDRGAVTCDTLADRLLECAELETGVFEGLERALVR